MSNWQELFAPDVVGKFASIDSLVKILTGRSLLWSRPNKFNDPFDCQPRFRSPVLTPDLERACVEEFLKVIDDNAPSLSTTNIAGKIHSVLSSAIKGGRVDRNEAVSAFVSGLRETMDPSRNFEKKYFEMLVGNLNDVKVLCLTRAFNNILMWSHYADNHRGALILFGTVSADSQFRIAQPVRYTDDLPYTYDPDIVPKLFSGQVSSTDPNLLDSAMKKVVFTKASAWSYENEFRILAGSGFNPDKEI
ncbi:MAG: DUF2971 domain-containing protein [Tabrizicola sp.]|nr:DUF2971 domain-containing protein [Tabrizicola sp.]